MAKREQTRNSASAPRQPWPNELRDHLANERTFLSWIRTAVTIIGLGFVVAKFGILIREVGGAHVHTLTARAGAVVGVLLVISGMSMAGLATVKFLSIRNDIDRNIVRFSPVLDVVIAVIIGATSIVLAVYLIITA